MRKLKIIEHISLDGVIQHSADDGDFPYSDWTAPYRTPAGRDAVLAAHGQSFDLCLAVAPTMSGRASGRRRRAVRWLTPRTPRRNTLRPTGRKALNGARSKALGRTSSRTFVASSRRTDGT